MTILISLKVIYITWSKISNLRKVTSNFQTRLSDDVRSIKKNTKLLIPDDKTNNLYELTTDEYNKLLTKNISKTYIKSNLSTMYNINAETKAIVQDLKTDKRIEEYNQTQSFLTLKDRKENFKNNPNVRLTNPVKSETEIECKEYIDRLTTIIGKKQM